MRRLIRDLIGDSRGATALEYALLAALLGTCLIASLTLLGSEVGNGYTGTKNAMANVNN